MHQKESFKKGQNLTEFAILLTLIAIGGILVYAMLGSQINKLFGSSEQKFKDFKPFGVAYNSDGSRQYKAGELGGTPAKPVTKCNGDTCMIDYGDFLLTGVPSNFDDYIQASGSSGGTDQIASIMEQIADQLESSNPTGATKLKIFANAAHAMGALQKQVENQAKTCSTNANSTDCMKTWLFSNNSFTLPTEYKSIFPDFSKDVVTDVNMTRLGSYDIGMARYRKVNRPWDFSRNQTIKPSYKAVGAFDDIIDDPKISLQIKSVTKELYDKIYGLDKNLESLTVGAANQNNYTGWNFNPFTGNLDSQLTINSGLTTDDLLHPNITMNTHVASQVICLNGRDKDNGYKCN